MCPCVGVGVGVAVRVVVVVVVSERKCCCALCEEDAVKKMRRQLSQGSALRGESMWVRARGSLD